MMKKVNIKMDELDPANNKHSLLKEEWNYRVLHQEPTAQDIVVLDVKKSVWWNRPLQPTKFCFKDTNNLYSYNIPLLKKDRTTADAKMKSGYNLLLPATGVSFASLFRVDLDCDMEEIYPVLRQKVVETLIELGVPAENLETPRNDILYKGQKCYGGEQLLFGDVYIENAVLTLNYSAEAKHFAKLTGKYAHARPIVGISEEYPNITKQKVMETVYRKLQEYYNK